MPVEAVAVLRVPTVAVLLQMAVPEAAGTEALLPTALTEQLIPAAGAAVEDMPQILQKPGAREGQA
jgi:hypothetical protein